MLIRINRDRTLIAEQNRRPDPPLPRIHSVSQQNLATQIFLSLPFCNVSSPQITPSSLQGRHFCQVLLSCSRLRHKYNAAKTFVKRLSQFIIARIIFHPSVTLTTITQQLNIQISVLLLNVSIMICYCGAAIERLTMGTDLQVPYPIANHLSYSPFSVYVE